MKTTQFVKLFVSALLLFGCGGNKGGNNPIDSIYDFDTTEVAQRPLLPTFVLSDQEGRMFLLLTEFNEDDGAPVPDSLENYKYIIYDGKYYAVEFNGYQPENEEENNYREAYYNFANLNGWLYEMEEGKLLTNPKNQYDAIWEAPLLVDENFKNSTKILPFRPLGGDPISDELKSKIEAKYGWDVLSSFVDYEFGENYEYQLINVQFKNKGNKALAISGIVCPYGKMYFKDFPAEWDDDESGSVWRVDDMGEFAGLGLCLVTEENGELTLYTANSGAEGTNYQNYVVKGDSLCEGKVTASFYQAPE